MLITAPMSVVVIPSMGKPWAVIKKFIPMEISAKTVPAV